MLLCSIIAVRNSFTVDGAQDRFFTADNAEEGERILAGLLA